MSNLKGRILVAATLVALEGVASGRPDTYLAASGSNGVAGSLYTIDPTTGAAGLIGPLVDTAGLTYGVTGMAFDAAGVLYGATSNASPNHPHSLLTINPVTAQVTFIADMGVPMSDISYRPQDGLMYGWAAVAHNMYTINLTTGAATLVGASGVGGGFGGGALAADSGGTMWSCPDSSSAPPGTLRTVNISTGLATTVAPLSGGPAGNNIINSAAFNSAGVMLGINSTQTASPATTYLVSISAAGVITNIGQNVGAGDLDALVVSGVVGAPTGACCTTSGTCIQTTATACAGGGGIYRGDNSPCSTANCPPGGACCLALGSCSVRTSAACAAASGIYRGDGTACATANCPGGFTMVCNAQGTFTDISSTGTFITDGDDSSVAFVSSVTNALVTNANLFACTNGFITSSALATFTNATLPLAGITFGLFPDWDDLYANAALVPPGKVVHQALVEGGVNVEIIQWSNISTFAAQAGPTGNFEVKIWAPGGPALVQYLYQDMSFDANGASSTVGVQWSGTLAYQNSFNTPNSIASNSVCNIIQTGIASCYPNCDHSTTLPCLNVNDFSCFLNAFAAGQTYANCDGSTIVPILNVNDFSCFLNRFAAGCSNC